MREAPAGDAVVPLPSPAIGAPASRSTRARLVARVSWLALAPLLLTLLALRYLFPERWEVGPGLWGTLARIGQEHALALAVGLFLLFSVLVRQFRDLLPGGHHLVPTAVSVTPPSGSAAAWRSISWMGTVVLAAAAALGMRAIVGQPYRVTSTSMLPGLEPFDTVLVNKLAFGIRLPGLGQLRARAPRRGDLVVFRASAVGETSEPLLVKRVIGLPGDRISTRGGLISINGWRVPYCDAGRYIHVHEGKPILGRLIVEFIEDRSYVTLFQPESLPFESKTVEAGEVFVIADNRNAGRDSRGWQDGRSAGVPFGAIEGRAWRTVGWDGNGHLDWHRLFDRPGQRPHLHGMDASAVEERIARCLENRPASTWPPPPRPS